jgi:hypothetical protein
LSPTQTYLPVSLTEDKNDTTEVIKAQLQVVLNTLTTSRMHLKKWQKHWEWCIRVEGDYFQGDGGQ